MPRKKTTNKKRLERVSVRAERRPEPDWDKFAYALLQYVKLTSPGTGTPTNQPKRKAAP